MHRAFAAVLCLALAIPWASGQGASSAASTANCSLDSNDVAVLNFLLKIEQLEHAFFTTGLQMISSNATGANTSSATAAAGLNASQLQIVNAVASDDNAHIAAIMMALNSSGCQVNAVCTFNFSGVNSATTFLQTGQSIESNVAAAYVGVSDRIRAADLRRLVASIAVVEGRHAAVTNELVGMPASPAPLNEALEPQAALAAFQPFIVSCPVNATLPQVVNCSSSSDRVPGSDAVNPVGESYHVTTAFITTAFVPPSAASALTFGGYLITAALAALLFVR